jgi:hypothetical protein
MILRMQVQSLKKEADSFLGNNEITRLSQSPLPCTDLWLKKRNLLIINLHKQHKFYIRKNSEMEESYKVES